MKLYEIDAALEELLSQVDENGELLADQDAIDALLLERSEKIEGLLLYAKNLNAEAEAIKAEEEALHKRREAAERKRDRLVEFAQRLLDGEKFQTARVAVSYRKSKAVDIYDEKTFGAWLNQHPEYLRQKAPEINRSRLGMCLRGGMEVPGAALVERVSMQVK